MPRKGQFKAIESLDIIDDVICRLKLQRILGKKGNLKLKGD